MKKQAKYRNLTQKRFAAYALGFLSWDLGVGNNQILESYSFSILFLFLFKFLTSDSCL